jgi:hypothetical protein
VPKLESDARVKQKAMPATASLTGGYDLGYRPHTGCTGGIVQHPGDVSSWLGIAKGCHPAAARTFDRGSWRAPGRRLPVNVKPATPISRFRWCQFFHGFQWKAPGAGVGMVPMPIQFDATSRSGEISV